MLILFYLALALAAFALAIRFYARFIAKSLGEDGRNPTPAVRINDGRDYVPTKRYVVFAHHFSAIAGAGPILGPTLALLYGFVPAWIWIVVGGIMIGAVHDFTTLFISIREGGKSMAEVARKALGKAGFNLFITLTIVMIVLVTSAFLSATAISLTSKWPIDKLGGTEATSILHTEIVKVPIAPVDKDAASVEGHEVGTTATPAAQYKEVTVGKIGGIASTSVIIITLMAPLLGWLIFKRRINTILAYLLAAAVCIGSVVIGVAIPVTFSPEVWMIIMSFYVLFAAGVPVWVILQPRDFINVQILYGGILLMVVSVVMIGFSGIEIQAPSWNLAEGTKNLGFLWPMMFITIACGAISGFHSMVAGGTTAKQLTNECDARKVGFNAMLLESALAICVLIAVAAAINFGDYKSIVWPTDPGAKSNPILGFSLAAGTLFHKALGIPIALGTVFGILLVEGFVITTLDAAVRLNRYLFEELWQILFVQVPAIMKHYWFNSGLSVILMWVFAYSNAFSTLWPIFGTANQLLAALVLLTVSAWLRARSKKYFYTLIPALFMMGTTFASLVILLNKYIAKQNWTLIVADVVMMLLSIGVVILVVKTFATPKPSHPLPLEGAETGSAFPSVGKAC
ncbi:MAG: carbon starvation protein A [bacterium]|nr:carbon starvation protein A [bacterium]